jgi:hypothetical protein
MKMWTLVHSVRDSFEYFSLFLRNDTVAAAAAAREEEEEEEEEADWMAIAQIGDRLHDFFLFL